ncbi:MAG: ABC transporter permease subunit [Lachnospiraceae bacterium]
MKNTLLLTVMIWGCADACCKSRQGMHLGYRDFRENFILLVLTRLMVSPESPMLANYLTVLKLNAYDTRVGIMLPYVVSAQAIFMFRQAFKQLPSSLLESARIDGCTDFQIYVCMWEFH